MFLITAFIHPHRFEEVRQKLYDLKLQGLTISFAFGHGRSPGIGGVFRGRRYLHDAIQRLKIELVVAEENKEAALNAIVSGSRSGQLGDGKVWVTPLNDFVRIRTEERGVAAL